MSTDREREALARLLYDRREGPVANQDFARQSRLWDECLFHAETVLAAGWMPRPEPGSEGLMIRPLEWKADHGDGYRLFGVDTPVGRFTYGTDRNGVCYWQSPSDDNPGRDTETEEQARAEAETLWRTLATAEIYKFALRAALNTGAPDAE